MKIYLGMVTLFSTKGVGSDNVSFAGFNKESVKSHLAEIAGEVLKEFNDAYKVEADPIDPEAIELRCNCYPRRIRYWIDEVEVIDGD